MPRVHASPRLSYSSVPSTAVCHLCRSACPSAAAAPLLPASQSPIDPSLVIAPIRLLLWLNRGFSRPSFCMYIRLYYPSRSREYEVCTGVSVQRLVGARCLQTCPWLLATTDCSSFPSFSSALDTDHASPHRIDPSPSHYICLIPAPCPHPGSHLKDSFHQSGPLTLAKESAQLPPPPPRRGSSTRIPLQDPRLQLSSRPRDTPVPLS